MFKTLGNIVRIPELRRRLLITAGILALCRIGVFVPIPGVNLDAIREILGRVQAGVGGKLFAIADLFAGGGLKRGSMFALGVMPYITASIVFQVLIAVLPALEKIAKEGESGRRRINQYTRYLTVVICFIQGASFAAFVYHQPNLVVPGSSTLGFYLTALLSMTGGTLLLMWMGEQIEEFGIGSGISLIIMVNIISRMPVAIRRVVENFSWKLGAAEEGLIDPARLAVLLVLFVFMIVSVVAITQAQRRIPISHSRRGGGFAQTSYLPLRVNMAGVISIIFAQAVVLVPQLLVRLGIPYVSALMGYFIPWKFWYVTLYMALIIFFTYFYTAVVFNPLEHAHQLKQNGAFIQGVRPGRQTAEYLHWIMNRITLPGAVFLAVIAVFPQLVSSTMQVDYLVASFFGGTALLIVVGVALDLVQRIENYLLMQYYEGFLGRGARIRGRRF